MAVWVDHARGLRSRGPFVLVLITILVCPARLLSQDAPLRYSASRLVCAEYHLSVNSTVQTERGATKRAETVGWDGQVLVVAEAHPDESVGVVAWFEQLEVWSETPEGRVSPGTGGLIGGRYRGRLEPSGVYHREVVPFMPEAIVAIVDLSTTLDELFPPVPARALAAGQSATDSLGWQYDRLSDTTWRGMLAQRFRVVHRDSSLVAADFGRGQIVNGTSLEVERGRLVWVDSAGPVVWTRRITTTVWFPAAALTPEAVVTRVDQRRLVERVGRASAPRCPVQ